MTCKWTYLAHEETGWQQDFFEAVGVPDLLSRGDLPERASLVGADLGPLTRAKPPPHSASPRNAGSAPG